MVATPTYDGTLHHRYVESYAAALLYCLYHKVELDLRIVAGSSLIQYARNQLVRLFLEDPSYTHMLWIDSDVGFDPRAIMQLLDSGKDLIGGVYPMKTMPLEWPYEPLPGEQTGELHRAKILPGGFLLCSRKVIESVAAKAETYVHHMQGMQYPTKHVFDVPLVDGVLLGEDVIFCQRARAAGFDVWCDPNINFSHSGGFEWRGNMREAIVNGQIAQPINAQALRQLRTELDPRKIGEICEELRSAWNNPYSPPAAELTALAILAKREGVTRILEAGSGISTLVLAAANPNAHVHALEQDADWCRRLISTCRSHGLHNVTLHLTPLDEPTYFYRIPKDLPPSFDLALVDGPTFLDGTPLSKCTDTRLGFYDELANRVRPGGVIVVDDVEHYGPQIERYVERELVHNRFAICRVPDSSESTAAA